MSKISHRHTKWLIDNLQLLSFRTNPLYDAFQKETALQELRDRNRVNLGTLENGASDESIENEHDEKDRSGEEEEEVEPSSPLATASTASSGYASQRGGGAGRGRGGGAYNNHAFGNGKGEDNAKIVIVFKNDKCMPSMLEFYLGGFYDFRLWVTQCNFLIT